MVVQVEQGVGHGAFDGVIERGAHHDGVRRQRSDGIDDVDVVEQRRSARQGAGQHGAVHGGYVGLAQRHHLDRL